MAAVQLAGSGSRWRSPVPPLTQLQRQQQQSLGRWHPSSASSSRRRRLGCLARAQQQQQQQGSGAAPAASTVAAAAAAAGLVGAPPGAPAGSQAAPPAEVPLPTSSSMDVTAMDVSAAGAVATTTAAVATPAAAAAAVDATDGSSNDDEPEVALVLVACGIGLATGAAIVAFNIGVHWIRDAIWEGQPLLSANRTLLRNIGESELWPKVAFPPLLGGLAVGALGLLIGGYDDKPPPKLAGAGGSGSGSSIDAGVSGSSNGAAAAAAGGAAVGGSGAASGSLALEQLKLQAAMVLRPVSRAVAAALTLGTGASLGPEGPSVDIGKSFARGLSGSLRSKQRHLTSLIAAGAGAGVAAGFNAPVAGVFFAVETVLQKQKLTRTSSSGDLQQQVTSTVSSLQPSGLTVAMVLLASVLAAVVSQAGLGSSPAFRVPEYRLESMWELPLYLVFGAICGVVSASFSFSTRVATDAFDELREQNSVEAALMPCIGGLTTGVLALGYPEILYQGFDNVNNILSGGAAAYAPGLLIQIVVMKVIATSICRGSGLQGGLYAPSIFIGASLGTAFGLMAHTVGDPAGLTLAAPQAYALVGIAAMLASNCQVPLTSVLLLFELTRDYLIIIPTMAAVGISFWISSLAAPSVKNAAASRRMSAAAAASAAVATTQLNPKVTEAVLVGSLQQQGRLSKAAPGGSGEAAGSAAGAAAAAAVPLAAASPTGTASSFNFGATDSGSFDGFDVPMGGSGMRGTAIFGPAQLAAAAARSGEELLVGAALERSCLLVEAEMTVDRALELMQADGLHVAVVLGADGDVKGLVTRDVLEQCVKAVGVEADTRAAAAAAAAAAPAPAAGSGSDSDGGSGGDAGSSGSNGSGGSSRKVKGASRPKVW